MVLCCFSVTFPLVIHVTCVTMVLKVLFSYCLIGGFV